MTACSPGSPRSHALQWHSAEVKKLPEDATVLAHSALCPIQAFRVGANAYGIQYHVELTEATVPEWGCVPAYETALNQRWAPVCCLGVMLVAGRSPLGPWCF